MILAGGYVAFVGTALFHTQLGEWFFFTFAVGHWFLLTGAARVMSVAAGMTFPHIRSFQRHTYLTAVTINLGAFLLMMIFHSNVLPHEYGLDFVEMPAIIANTLFFLTTVYLVLVGGFFLRQFRDPSHSRLGRVRSGSLAASAFLLLICSALYYSATTEVQALFADIGIITGFLIGTFGVMYRSGAAANGSSSHLDQLSDLSQ